MIAVIFEVRPKPEHKQQYLDLAAELRPILETIGRFHLDRAVRELTEKARSCHCRSFRDEAAVAAWRNIPQHRGPRASPGQNIQRLSPEDCRRDQDYGMNDRAQAPTDSRAVHERIKTFFKRSGYRFA